MSEISGNKKYVTLEGVRISYRPKDDSIQITSTDDDLAGENFHLVLKKNTDAEKALRQLLVSKGLIQDELKKKISESLPKKLDNPNLNAAYTPWNEIVLGEKAKKQPVVWNVITESHALIAGPTGSGKSIIQATIFNHCLIHRWDFYGIDMKRVELSHYRVYTETTKSIATTQQEGLLLLQKLVTIMKERYDLMEEVGVNHYLNLPNDPFKPIMLMLDEAFMFLGLSGANTEEGKANDQMAIESSDLIGKLLRTGRTAGIHVVMATQRPDATVIKGEMKRNMDIRIAAGRMDSTPSSMILDSDEATKLPGGIRGRGMIRSQGKLDEFQAYHTHYTNFADQWVLLQQGRYEKDRYNFLISSRS